jgi:small-conductance mechanosensitive channel
MAWLRQALATVWHWIALVLIMALWFVWAVEVPNGFAQLLRFTFVTGALLISARLLMILLNGLIERGLSVPLTRFPNLETRLHLYQPIINGLLRFGVYALTLLALLQFYGLSGLTWLAETDLGHRIASAFATIAVTFLLAVAVWEAANIAIDRHLENLAKEEQAVRSARLRTLLPLLRTALAITILVFAGLTVLSEIGINIAPLLAGAGIIGVAIGFGSQKLVQDLINGIFLLLENAMQVGDQVTVSGLSGAVEALSVRTIRLRAGDGSVHVIPFSAVTSVTNVNRGIGNASVSVVVAYTEDTDHVAAVLTEIVAAMRSEQAFAGKMLSDLQLWGVDKIDGAGATIVGQVVCTDSGRWSVQRELNRRIKMRFQELGISLFNPMRNIAIPSPPQAPAQASPPTEERPHERSRAAE